MLLVIPSQAERSLIAATRFGLVRALVSKGDKPGGLRRCVIGVLARKANACRHNAKLAAPQTAGKAGGLRCKPSFNTNITRKQVR
jgi:hypothetical protein